PLYFLLLFSMPTATTESGAATKPVKVFRDGRLSISVFRNFATVREQERAFHNVSIQRSYKEGDGYKSTHSLGKDDLPAVQLLLAQAWQWIVTEDAALRKKTVA